MVVFQLHLCDFRKSQIQLRSVKQSGHVIVS